jgi:hypothetical protein
MAEALYIFVWHGLREQHILGTDKLLVHPAREKRDHQVEQAG